MRQQKMQQQLQSNDDKVKVEDIRVELSLFGEAQAMNERRKKTGWEEFWTSLKSDKDFLSENEKMLLTKYFKKEVSYQEANAVEHGFHKEGVYSFDGLLAQNDPKLVAEFLEGLRKIKNAVDGVDNKHNITNSQNSNEPKQR